MTRQRRRQIELAASGRCPNCAKRRESVEASKCLRCLASERENKRAKYRARHGIPLDAPVARSGRPRIA